MLTSRLGMAAIALATVPLIAMAIVAAAPLVRDSFNGTSSPAAVRGSVGGSRDTYLAELSRLYAADDVEAVAAIAGGSRLAPLDFLNQQLEQRGVKWRVREIKGANAETFDIS